MATRGSRTDCILREDPRLIAGIGAVVSHAAGRAGLVEWDQTKFAQVTEEACRETLATLSRISHRESIVQLAVADFPGRVEVTIEPAAASESNDAQMVQGRAAVTAVEGVCRTLQRKGVDRVLCETRANSFRMKLIKYCSHPKSAASD